MTGILPFLFYIKKINCAFAPTFKISDMKIPYFKVSVFLAFLFYSVIIFAQENPEKKIFDELFSSNSIRQAAAIELIKKTAPASLPSLLSSVIVKDRDDEKRGIALDALKLYPKQAVLNQWMDILSESESIIIQEEVIKYFSDVRDRRLVPHLAKKLSSPYAIIRKLAAQSLQKNGDDRIYPYILDLAVEQKPVHRIYFLEAMFYLYDRRFASNLTGMLKDENKSVRIYVLECIYANRLADYLHLVREAALSDKNDEVRIAAVEIIGNFSDARSVYVLHKTLTEKNPELRLASAKALLQINSYVSAYALGTQLAEEDDDAVKEVILDALEKLRRSGNIKGLERAAVSEKKMRIRLKAVFLLGEISEAAAVPVLYKCIEDADFRIRAEASNSLGNYRNRQVHDLLISVIKKDKSKYVRSAALYAVKRHSDRASAVALFDIFSSEEEIIIRELLREALRDMIKKYTGG